MLVLHLQLLSHGSNMRIIPIQVIDPRLAYFVPISAVGISSRSSSNKKKQQHEQLQISYSNAVFVHVGHWLVPEQMDTTDGPLGLSEAAQLT